MRRTITLIAAAALLFAVGPVRGDTIAYWRFEDGTPPNPAGTLVTQYNSPALNATATSPYPTFNSDLPLGGGSIFSQPNTASLSLPVNDGGVRVAWLTDNPLLQQNAFTIEAFVKLGAGVQGYGGIVEKVPTPGGDTWSLGLSGSYSLFSRFDTTTNNNFTFAGGPSLNDGKWHHVALTYSYDSLNNNGAARLYLDYVLVASPPTVGGVVPGALVHGMGLTFGGGGGGHTQYAGLIDEVRFSNVVLAPYQFLGVPEPTAAVLLVSGILALLGWLRFRR